MNIDFSFIQIVVDLNGRKFELKYYNFKYVVRTFAKPPYEQSWKYWIEIDIAD